MDKLFELKTLLKKDLYLSLIAPLKKPSKNGGSFKALTVLGLVILFFYLAFLYFMLILAFIIPMAKIGKSNLILSGFFGFVSLATIIFTSAGIISKIYYSKDVELLLPLPLRRNNIFISKILGSVAIAFLVSFIIFIPMVFPLIKFGNLSFLKFFSIIFLNLSNIIFTVLILSIIIILFMKIFAGIGGLKNLLQALGFIFVIVLSFSPQFLSKSDASKEFVEKNLIKFIKLLFPQVYIVDKVYGMNNISCFLISLGILILMAIIFYVLSFPLSNLMIDGVLKANNVSSKVKKVRGNKNTAIAISLAKKDVSNVIKTPVYFFNLASGAFMFPILMIFGFLKGESIKYIQEFFANTESFGFGKIDLFFVFMIVLFFYSAFITPLSLTSITREGKNIYLMQTLPISYEDQVKGRILGSTIFQIISSLPLLLLLAYFTKFNVIYIFAMFIGSFLGSYASSSFGIFYGIKYPKLDWENPQEAVKRNFPVFLFSILSMAAMAFSAFILFQIISNFSSLGVIKFIILAYLIIAMALSFTIKKQAEISLKEKLPEYNS
ncbi:MAG: hypothetical protein E6064_08250 [Peptoniphilus harei]|nr:hypothetical protein [Peptoniphilus harei]